jgi:hypothetical protein
MVVFFIQLYRWFAASQELLTIIRPETLVRWHRAGFRGYWRWKSRPLGGRPKVNIELRALVRRMSVENPLWGAPRIHGELLKLGFEVARRALPSTWLGDGGHPARDGEPSCVTMLQTLPPWTCSLSRPLGPTGSPVKTVWRGSATTFGAFTCMVIIRSSVGCGPAHSLKNESSPSGSKRTVKVATMRFLRFGLRRLASQKRKRSPTVGSIVLRLR